jgi:hypothetical protein
VDWVDRRDGHHQSENPLTVNRNRNASANSIGGSKLSEFHIVADQLNTFTPVGTAISTFQHEEHLARERQADREHVVRPDDERQ